MTVLNPTAAIESSAPPRSLWRDACRRYFKNRLAVVGMVLLILLAAVCFGSVPYWLRDAVISHTTNASTDSGVPNYAYQDLNHAKEPPSYSFLMGTDNLGRSLLGRFMVGGALSLSIGLASAAIAVFIGTTVGMIAGYAGGTTDAVLMRFVDILYGLPYILLVILMRVALVPWLGGILQNHIANPTQWANVIVLLVGIGSISWLTMARVIRGQVLSLRDQPFIEAARALGISHSGILLRHLLPNLVGPILVYATLTVPGAILSESFLSFLGLGIQPPMPSWGNLAAEGVEALNPVQIHWWLIVWPCVGLSLALLSLNFIGDGLRDALDPKGR